MSLVSLLHFLEIQHVSDINMSIFRSLHPNSNTQQFNNNTDNVVVQQHSRKLLKMGILMPETC